MTIQAASAATHNTSANGNDVNKNTMDLTLQVFLKQLTCQNPMDPDMKPSDITDHLIKMVTVKENAKQTLTLEELSNKLDVFLTLMAGGLKDKVVEVPGDSFSIGAETMDVQMPADVRLAYVEVMNANEEVVSRIQCDAENLQPGLRRIPYAGKALKNGEYTYRLTAYVEGSEDPVVGDARPMNVNNKPVRLAYDLSEHVPTGGDHPVPYLAVDNQAGRVVKKIPISGQKGRHELEIEPVYTNGSPLDAGNYKFRVIAKNKDMKPIDAKLSVLGTVDAIKRDEGKNLLNVYNRGVDLRNVLAVM